MILALNKREDYEDSRFRNLRCKFALEQATNFQRGSRCITLLFLQPRYYMGLGGQRHAPATLSPGKIRYPLYRRLGVPQGKSGMVRKNSPPPRFNPWTVQPVASFYTDWAIWSPVYAHRLVNTYRRFEGSVPFIFMFKQVVVNQPQDRLTWKPNVPRLFRKVHS
jgi:hypothetical protein